VVSDHLKDLYGIEAKDNIWYNGRTKELSHGGALGLDKAGPVGVTHHWLTVDQTLDVMLDHGDIDACTAIRSEGRVTAGDPTVIDRYGGTPVHGNRVCGNYWRITARAWSMNTTGRPDFSIAIIT